MKRSAFILSILPFLVSCTNWLDVKPYDAVEREDAFKNERMANKSLNGLYILLSDAALYGQELSAGTVEILGQNFTFGSPTSGEHRYNRLRQYDYNHDRAAGILNTIWSNAYSAIANCNEFIKSVEQFKANFSREAYNFYMGEAIGIRTLLHFDLLRLFGPVGTELGKSSIPYNNVSSDIPQPILAADKLLDLLIADMDMAIEYLEKDPIRNEGGLGNTAELLESDVPFDATFKPYRNMRMNYFAANALKARMCLYRGTEASKAEAYEIVTNIIATLEPVRYSSLDNSNANRNRLRLVKLGNATDAFVRRVFYPEVLFGIHNMRIGNMYDGLFNFGRAQQETFRINSNFYNVLFGTSVAGNDPGLRKQLWTLDEVANTYAFDRFKQDFNVEPLAPFQPQFQCVFRIGELYFIAAELAPDVEQKRYWIDQFRLGKGYDVDNAKGLNDEQLDKLIENELRKDTYGEGQYFFYAKRRNLPSFANAENTTNNMDASKYVPPLPLSEVNPRREN